MDMCIRAIEDCLKDYEYLLGLLDNAGLSNYILNQKIDRARKALQIIEEREDSKK